MAKCDLVNQRQGVCCHAIALEHEPADVLARLIGLDGNGSIVGDFSLPDDLHFGVCAQTLQPAPSRRRCPKPGGAGVVHNPEAGVERFIRSIDRAQVHDLASVVPEQQHAAPKDGYLSEKWIVGAFLQNWTSFGGSGPKATNSINLQPFAAYFLPDGWGIGYSGNILADWKASATNAYTVPIGIAISKVMKLGPLPVKFQLAGQWMPVHPTNFGQVWNLQLSVTPVLPKLMKGNLLEPESLRLGLGR